MMPWQRTLGKLQVVVNLNGGQRAFRGVFWARRGPLIVLRNAVLLESGNSPVNVDGEVVIERSRVEFYQILPDSLTGRLD